MQLIRVYYANQLLFEHPWSMTKRPQGQMVSRKQMNEYGNEIYNGALIHWPTVNPPFSPWFRGDMTPVLLEDVPEETRMLHLLIS